jgi:hypothetical protein
MATTVQQAVIRSKKNGNVYLTTHTQSIAAGQYLLIRVKTGLVKTALTFNFYTEALTVITFLDIVEFLTPGTELTPVNLKVGSVKTANHQVFYAPNNWWQGGETGLIPSPGSESGKGVYFSGGGINVCGGFVSMPNKEYLLSMQNLDLAAASLGIGIIGVDNPYM